MSHDDWNPDDFLDFDYGNSGSQKQSNKDYSDEYSEYLASRKAQQAEPVQMPKTKAKTAKQKRKEHSFEEKAALRKAQQEADKRYRGNYDKNTKRKSGKRRANKPSIWITRMNLLTLAVFLGSMAFMDVLSMVWLCVLIAALLLLSILVLPKMR